jgi:polysaccharide pyruvyl transferase CsaB
VTAVVPGRRVVIGGWYGAANLGDEMILGAFLEWIREADGVPTVISVNPHYTRGMHDVNAVGYNDLPAIVEAVAAADLLLLGGGGLFQDYDVFDARSLARFPAANVSQFAQFLFLADELGVDTAVLAQGVGPLRGDEARAVAAEVFQRAGTSSVRDEESALLLRAIAVERPVAIAPDPAWTLRTTPIEPASRYPALAGRPVMALVLRDWPFDRRWEDAFVAAYDDALPRDWGCLWLDFSRAPDAVLERPLYDEIAPRLAARLPRLTHVVWDGMRLQDAAALIAGSDALIAMRLHGVLLGHLAALPVVALEYDGKVKALGDALGVPAALRMPLEEIAERLPDALRAVCGSERRSVYRLDAGTRARLADDALAHRALLWQAMAAAPRASRKRARRESLLAGWMSGEDDDARRRIVAALVGRLRRVGD